VALNLSNYQLHNGKPFQTITVDELLKLLDKYKYTSLQVHCTADPDIKTWSKTPNGSYWAERIDSYHRNSRGWKCIGEHININPDGTVTLGRNFGLTPAGIEGYNTGAFMFEMIGNFDKGRDILQGAQKETVLKIAKYFDSKGIYIRFHREKESRKTCPGSGIDKDQFMKEVRAYNGKTKEEGGYPLFKRVLKHGMDGEDVGQAQRLLKALGYYSGPVDNKFGPGIGFLNAVKAFQKDNGLEADGNIGEKTQAKMLEIMLQAVENPKVDNSQIEKLQKEIADRQAIINAQNAEVEKLNKDLKQCTEYFKLQKSLLDKANK